MKPLAGLTVVSIEQAVAAPYCSSRLADAGARVIKVERPDRGDFARDYDRVVRGQSAYFVWLNRGKESIALDLKDSDDAQLLARMIARADVFIQNLAPGAAARAGLGSAQLRHAHSRLITCSISGYGESGPYASAKAYDLLVQAETALASITGRPEGPGRVGVSVCDIAAGMYACMAILEAIIERQATGRGSSLSVSLFDAVADWMNVPLLTYLHGGKAPERIGLHHPSIGPYGAYPTTDHRLVMLAVQNEREWRRFCTDVLGRPDLVNDPRFLDNTARVANRRQLDGIITSVLSTLSRDQAIRLLRAADIAHGAVNSVKDLATHPMLRMVPVSTPEGPIDLVAPPVIKEGGDDFPLRPVPQLDEHGESLRAEFSD